MPESTEAGANAPLHVTLGRTGRLEVGDAVCIFEL